MSDYYDEIDAMIEEWSSGTEVCWRTGCDGEAEWNDNDLVPTKADPSIYLEMRIYECKTCGSKRHSATGNKYQKEGNRLVYYDEEDY